MLSEEIYRLPDIAFCTDTSAELFDDNDKSKCITYKY